MGSDSDLPVMQEAAAMLQEFGIEYEMTIASAHRTPKKVLEYSSSAEKRGLKAIIAGAGWAAHLAGVVASQTTLPVIGVPIDSSSLKGIDALLSTVQMPGGVPVATMSLGKAGAKNAGIFAAQILAAMDVKIANRLKVYKVEMEREVEEKAKRLVTITSMAATAKVTAPAKASTPARVAAPVKMSVSVREEEPAAEVAPAKKKSRRRRWKKKPGGAAPAQGPAA
jgi:phosphoribosylaminoimidazole carboxylase PurE protein